MTVRRDRSGDRGCGDLDRFVFHDHTSRLDRVAEPYLCDSELAAQPLACAVDATLFHAGDHTMSIDDDFFRRLTTSVNSVRHDERRRQKFTTVTTFFETTSSAFGRAGEPVHTELDGDPPTPGSVRGYVEKMTLEGWGEGVQVFSKNSGV